MNFKEAEKRIWREASLKKKILMTYWGFIFTVQHLFRRITKICPHDSTLGAVGQKQAWCIDCHEMVDNPEWKEERRALKKLV